MMTSLACSAPDPLAACYEVVDILDEAEVDPYKWTTRRTAPTSVTEEKAQAEVIRRVAAMESDDPYLDEGFAKLRRAAERHRAELDKLLDDSPQGSNVRLAGSTAGYMLIALIRRCNIKAGYNW
ncbi:hypothetical protein [Spongiactinospora sp. 9N601]|uniref:hypothetical protein n=1 Tax=Spongiactinospora sp. 9N601 TaxID=3375149 RepID=UPI00378D5E05